MSTQTMLLGGIAILLLLASSSKQGQTLIGGAQPAGKSGGARTYGPAAPLPAQAPSGSPGSQTQGATILGSLTTNIFANADKIGSAIGDIISAARATDTGDDGSDEPNIASPVPVLAQGVGSGASWLGFGPPEIFQSDAPNFADVFAQDSSLDMAVPDFKFIPEA